MSVDNNLLEDNNNLWILLFTIGIKISDNFWFFFS
jgi:hypothetical protein